MNLNAITDDRARLFEWRMDVVGNAVGGGEICEICRGRECPECHHIIGRGTRSLRYDKKNGIVVCRPCHKRPDLVWAWLEINRPKLYAWLMKKKNELHHGQKIDLEEIRMNLELRI